MSNKHELPGRFYGTTREILRGDLVAAGKWVGFARVLLGNLRHRMALEGVPISSASLTTQDGTHIRVVSSYGIDQIDIEGSTLNLPDQVSKPVVYEFAMQFSVTELDDCEFLWIVVSFGERGWQVSSYPNQSGFRLLSIRDHDDGGIITSPLGDNVIYGVSKLDHNVWHNGNEIYSQRNAWGGGQICFAPRHANRYGNYMLSTGMEVGGQEVYWYNFVGRDRPYGKKEPIAEGVAQEGKYRVAVNLRGEVTVTRVTDNEQVTSTPEFPAWTKGNDLDYGHVGGAWHLNSNCTRAVSVLHGNPFPTEALSPFFDMTQIMDPEADPSYSGAFFSAIFVIDITITEHGDTFLVAAIASRYSELTYVMTAGLSYGYPEAHSKGDYLFAADFDENDEVVYATIHYWSRQTIESITAAFVNTTPVGSLDEDYPALELEGLPVDEALPYKYHKIVLGAEVYNVIEAPYSRHYQVRFIAPYNDTYAVTKKVYHRELRFSNSQVVLVLDNSGSITVDRRRIDLSGTDNYVGPGPSSSPSYELNQAAIVDNYSAILEGVSPPPPVPGATFSPGVVVHPTQIETQWSETTYDDTIKTRLGAIDLRAKTLFYTQEVTSRSNATLYVRHQTTAGVTTSAEGLETFYSITTKNYAGVYSPIEDILKELDSTFTPAPDPDDEASFSSVPTGNDYASSPLVIRLWHTMVMGCENPKTPDGFGGTKGFFFDYTDYLPNQMCGAYNSINWHPNGFYGIYADNGALDIIRCKVVGETSKDITLSHEEVLEKLIKQSEEALNDYISANPDKTELEAARELGVLTQARLNTFLSGSITNRGEWIF